MFGNKKKSAINELIELIEKKIEEEPDNWTYDHKRKLFKYKNGAIFISRDGQLDVNTANGGIIELTDKQIFNIQTFVKELAAIKGLRNMLKD